MASFTVYLAELRDDSVETWSKRETIDWTPYTPSPTHTDICKNQCVSSFQYRDSGFTEEEEVLAE